jgi:hypothetical protein
LSRDGEGFELNVSTEEEDACGTGGLVGKGLREEDDYGWTTPNLARTPSATTPTTV